MRMKDLRMSVWFDTNNHTDETFRDIINNSKQVSEMAYLHLGLIALTYNAIELYEVIPVERDVPNSEKILDITKMVEPLLFHLQEIKPFNMELAKSELKNILGALYPTVDFTATSFSNYGSLVNNNTNITTSEAAKQIDASIYWSNYLYKAIRKYFRLDQSRIEVDDSSVYFKD